MASTTSGSPIGMQLWTSTNGVNWTGPSPINPSNDPGYFHPHIAVAGDGQGWVMYDENLDRATVEDLTGPVVNPPLNPQPIVPTLFKTKLGKSTKKLHGSLVQFFSPKACVPQNRLFTAVYSAKHSKKKKLKAKGYVKAFKVSFRVLTLSKKQIKGAGKRVFDSKKPFQTRKLSTVGLTKGKSYLLRVAFEYRRTGVGTVKQRLKKRKKSIYRKLKVCN